MNTKRFLIVALVLVVALAISAFAIVSFNGSQRAQTGGLTSLNADQVSAYRWKAMAQFYEAQGSQAGDLTALDAMRFRSYKGYPVAVAVQYGPPGR